MITPWIIRVLYFVAQIVITIAALIYAFGGSNLIGYGPPIQQFFLAILFFIVASLLARLIFELLIVQFQICENTSQLKHMLENKNVNNKNFYKHEDEGGSKRQILFCGHCGEKLANSTAGDNCSNCGEIL